MVVQVLLVVGCLAVLLLLGNLWPAQGLTRTLYTSEQISRQSLWLWPYSDGADFDLDDKRAGVTRLEYEGIVWQGNPGETTWRIRHNGQIKLLVDGAIVLDEPDPVPLRSDDITVSWQDNWTSIHLMLERDILSPQIAGSRPEFGIYEQGIAGRWRLLPSYRLFAQVPATTDVNRAAHLHIATQLTLLVLLASLSSSAMIVLFAHRLWTYKSTWIILGLVITSLIVRLILMAERSASDPSFFHLPPGGDDNYTLMARQLLSGNYALAGTFWPPGPILWFAGISTVFGPHLWKLYLANVLVSAVGAGALTCAGWLGFGRPVGIIAGLIYTFYPPLVFYQVTTQSVVLDVALVSISLFFGMIVFKHGSLRAAAAFGLFVGIAGLSRATSLLLGPAFVVALLLHRSPRWFALATVAAGFALLPLLPQSLANFQATDTVSIIPSGNGSMNIYAGNNRDSDGTWVGHGLAWDVAFLKGGDWSNAIMDDLESDPLRVAELIVRKMALFWSHQEGINNVNYQVQGLGHSPTLRFLSADGRIGMSILAFITWSGMVLMLKHRSAASSFLLILSLLLAFSITLFIVTGRLRVPSLPVLILVAAYALVTWYQTLRRRELKPYMLVAVVVPILFTWAGSSAVQHLPRQNFAAAPPDHVLQTRFESGLTLVGFDTPDTDHATYLYMSLVWQLPQETTIDHTVFVELADAAGRVVGTDQPIGAISFPNRPTSTWPEAASVREGYLIMIPPELAGRAFDVNVGVYPGDSLNALPIVDVEGQATNQRLARLTGLGVRNDAPLDPSDQLPLAQFEQTLQLLDVRFQRSTSTDTPLDIGLDWRTNAHILQDWVIFIHALDANGDRIAQVDQQMLGPGRVTSTLVPGEPFTSGWQIDLPHGQHALFLGAYRLPDARRIAVTDGTGNPLLNNLVPLGDVRVTEP